MNFSLIGNKEFIRRLTELVLENLGDENFGVKELVAKTGMNPSTIHRRLKAVNNKTISQFINEIRLRKALELLQQDAESVSDVAYRVGFNSPAYFNKCFHEYYGYPPGEYKKRGLIKDEESQDRIAGEFAETEETKRPWKRMIIFASSGILAVIILTFLINNFFPQILTIKRDKSIAVLPIVSLSNEPNAQYLAEGMMDAILVKLCNIKDLRVMSRTSVEQYRGTHKTMPQIGRELKVQYLLETSVQKVRDSVKLIAQLINAGKRKESHAWAKEYDRNWKNIFSVQSEVAQTVAGELGAVITPGEKKRIEKAPTADLTAYDFYMQANGFKQSYWNTRNISAYTKAYHLYMTALAFDSVFAEAWVGMGAIYAARCYLENKRNFQDSSLLVVDKALAIDDQLWEAYYLKGEYFRIYGNMKEALDNYDKSSIINPNYYWNYARKATLFTWTLSDFVEGIDNYNKASSLMKEDAFTVRVLGLAYMQIGFPEKAKYYFNKSFDLDGDKSVNWINLALIEFCRENFDKAVELAIKADLPDHIAIFTLAPGHTEEAYSCAKKLIENYKKQGTVNRTYSGLVGSAFYQAGRQKEADNYFKEQIKYAEEDIKLGNHFAYSKGAHYEMAASYAMLGDKVKAYQYLDEFDKKNSFTLWQLIRTKRDPLFNSIRGEERFQKILQNMEAKYQAEHERVRKWLAEQ